MKPRRPALFQHLNAAPGGYSRVFADNLQEELLPRGHAVCPCAELMTFDLLLGQPVTRLRFVPEPRE